MLLEIFQHPNAIVKRGDSGSVQYDARFTKMFAITLCYEVGFMPDTVNRTNNHISILQQFMQVN